MGIKEISKYILVALVALVATSVLVLSINEVIDDSVLGAPRAQSVHNEDNRPSIGEDQKPRELPIINVLIQSFDPPPVGKAIRVDLDAMRLYLYEDGEFVREYDVMGKGRIGAYWETPGGEFEILLKKDNHFSSTGRVWMPYSMQFFGNYFIHGWPYKLDGTPVPPGFSGGCIRLGANDAKEVFGWTSVGTRVYIHGGESESLNSSGRYVERSSNVNFKVRAESYIVGDIDTGEIILGKNIYDSKHPRSLTKLMTALVELGVVHQQHLARVSGTASAMDEEESQLRVGKVIETSELVYPLILELSNVAAEALAEHVGKSHFVSQMNTMARAYNLSGTHFVDPSGWSEENISNAVDLFRVGTNAKKYKSFIFNISKVESRGVGDYLWTNKSNLIGIEGYQGGLAGPAGRGDESAFAMFKIPLAESSDSPEKNIGIVVMGSNAPEDDILSILEYIKENVTYEFDLTLI